MGFVMHDGEVLVFEHPTTGTQFPAGTVEPGESAAEAVRREVAEEVGVDLSGGRLVGVQWRDVTRRFFAWSLDSRPPVPEMCETDGHRFRPYWLSVDAAEQVLHPLQRPWWRFGPRDEVSGPRFRRLEDDRVTVRALTDRDADYESLGRWMSDDRVLRWYGGESHRLDASGARAYYRPRIRGADDVHPAIIECDGESVGYLQYYPIESYTEYQLDETDPPGAWALDLFIGEPGRWGEGIGPRAIDLVLRYLDEDLGVNDVFIDPWVENERAIAAYHKCGFRKVRVLPEHERHGGQLIDCWLMHRPLLAPDRVDDAADR